MPTLKVEFSITPPSKEIFNQIFERIDFDVPQDVSNLASKSSPHPSLVPVWALLTEDVKTVGLATIYLPPPQSLELAPVFIGNMAIEKKSQGKGLESFLLTQLVGWCQQKQIRLLTAQPSDEIMPFFLSQGFAPGEKLSSILFKAIEATI